jgi:uncharacterized protein (TIGR02996 family)
LSNSIREAFEADIAAAANNRQQADVRLIYADQLDELGDPDEAMIQRLYTALFLGSRLSDTECVIERVAWLEPGTFDVMEIPFCFYDFSEMDRCRKAVALLRENNVDLEEISHDLRTKKLAGEARKLRVDLNEEDIAKGIHDNPKECAIARALRRTGHADVEVYWMLCHADGVSWHVPNWVSEEMERAAYRKEHLKPFSFHVERKNSQEPRY